MWGDKQKTIPRRYKKLQRNIILMILLVTLIPLTVLFFANSILYRKNLLNARLSPMEAIAAKTAHSFELFLEERLSVLRFIAASYDYDTLADSASMRRIFRILNQKYGGYVDIGLINSSGIQVSYAGPYRLLGKDYHAQDWFHEVVVRGEHISDVFMGYRGFPHIALAVMHMTDEGDFWIIRATMDTKKFKAMILSIGIDPIGDAFLLNTRGILQTDSRYYGNVLEKIPFEVPRSFIGARMVEAKDIKGREIFLIYHSLVKYDFLLAMVLPKAIIAQPWYEFRKEILAVYLFSIFLIVLVIIGSTSRLVRRIREADERREAAFRELEYTQKLSSIGRLAAGVAHEINNPLAIINEKAGLIQDLVKMGRHKDPEKLMACVVSIAKSVERCRNITHRLLGFARRIGPQYEDFDLNEVVSETIEFLEKEAHYRNITIDFEPCDSIGKISSDRGQLQQVFLNILSNAIAAVEDNTGRISIRIEELPDDRVAVSIADNGHGMSETTIKHIFEPFFTTKKAYGTGLGLSITYGIVKRLGGDIRVHSRLGEGSTFTVVLPRKSPGESNNGKDSFVVG